MKKKKDIAKEFAEMYSDIFIEAFFIKYGNIDSLEDFINEYKICLKYTINNNIKGVINKIDRLDKINMLKNDD